MEMKLFLFKIKLVENQQEIITQTARKEND